MRWPWSKPKKKLPANENELTPEERKILGPVNAALLEALERDWEERCKEFGIHKEYIAAKEEEKKWEKK